MKKKKSPDAYGLWANKGRKKFRIAYTIVQEDPVKLRAIIVFIKKNLTRLDNLVPLGNAVQLSFKQKKSRKEMLHENFFFFFRF